MGALSSIRDFFRTSKSISITDPVHFAENNIHLEHIVGNSTKGYVKIDPHQREPFLALFDNCVREVTIMAPPQVGKSFIWQLAITVKAAHGAYKGWIAYENDEKASEVNTLILTPLFKSIPKLKAQLEKPNSYNKKRYKLDETVIFYTGFQNEFATHSVMEFYASETDRTKQTLNRREAVYNTIRPRVSRFETQNRSKICVESSPDTIGNISWKSFKRGNQSWWHIRCLNKKCQHLIPSHTVDGIYKNGGWLGGLQFKRDLEGEIIEESIRFHCTKCNRAHEQRDLEEMNRLGEYVTEFEGRSRHKSFQFGWAAGFRSRTFMAVAEERMKLAENDDYVQQLSFDNNIRGLPHQNRRKKAASNKILEGHCVDKLIDPDELSATFLISDTQDNSSPWVLLGVDAKANIHVLDHGIEELLVGYEEDEFGRPAGLYHDHWNRFYGDYKPTLMLIDEGGTRTSEVCALVQYDNSGGIFTYKGNSRRSHYEKNVDEEDELLFPGGKHFSRSDQDPWRILADPNWYHDQLLYKLYAMENRGSNYIYFEPSHQCDDQFFKQILAQRPPKNSPDAPFSKWNAGTHDERCDDYFDCLKMGLVLIDFAKKYMEFGPDGWRKDMGWMD